MTNWFYYNEQGEKIAVTGGQLKGLAKAGLITPETIVETSDGKKARAGKVKGLTFVTSGATPSEPAQAVGSESYGLAAPPPKPIIENPFTIPVSETVKTPIAVPSPFTQTAQVTPPKVHQPAPQNVSISVEAKSKTSLITIVGILALLIVSGIGWAIMSATSSVRFTVAEQREIDSFLTQYGNEFGNNVKTANQDGTTLDLFSNPKNCPFLSKICLFRASNGVTK